MKVVLYARVSTEDQNVKQQIDYLVEWFKVRGFVIVATIADEESGRLPLLERKKFKGILEKTRAEPTYTDAIGIYNLDRLTRNWDDVTYIEKHFRELWDRLKLISTSDSIDLSNASGRMMFRVKMCVSCFMPEDMREKQKIGIDRAKSEGKYKGGIKGRSWSYS